MKFRGVLLAMLLALAGASACSSSGETEPGPPTLHPSISTSSQSGDTLTGFGATRASWNAYHAASTDPNLDKGCCYGPLVDAPDNGGTAYEWNVAGSAPDVITLVTHNFRPGTSQADALAAVIRDDLPRDVRRGPHGVQDECETWIFTSARLGVEAELGESISVTLYSPVGEAGTQSSYDPSDVVQAIEAPDDDPSVAC